MSSSNLPIDERIPHANLSGARGCTGPTMSGGSNYAIGHTGPGGPEENPGCIPVERALEIFTATGLTNPLDADRFFERCGAGNIVEHPERPYERFRQYERLLIELKAANFAKYQGIHKGTPFGFLSWLAFDMHDYEKGLFYLDAAVAEDIKNQEPPQNWTEKPGARVLTLDTDPANLWFRRTVADLNRLLQSEISRFNEISNRPEMDLAAWQRFVRNLIVDPGKRTIVSALYVFLLEFEDRLKELGLREGSVGGSNQPFTVHLFTGGLLFESLLKHCYPDNGHGRRNKTLGDILFRTPAFLTDFEITGTAISTSADSLLEPRSGSLNGRPSWEAVKIADNRWDERCEGWSSPSPVG